MTPLAAVIGLFVLAATSPRLARADAVVGTGTPASCTEAALNAVLGCAPDGICSSGGNITFNCGGAGVVSVTDLKIIAANTSIDGGGLIALNGLSGVGATPVFDVKAGVTLTLANLAINLGGRGSTFNIYSATGGAIYNNGTLNVTNSTFSANSASNSAFDHSSATGGAIYNNGMMTVTNSTFSGNDADANAGDARGGAIYNNGTLTVGNSTFSLNSANGGSGTTGGNGGAIYNNGTLTVANSTFSFNSTFGSGRLGGGGAILNAASGTVNVTNCTFSGNRAYDNGYGGGIYSYGTLTITNSTFSGNAAGGDGYSYGYGGGIYNYYGGTLTVTNTIIANSPTGLDCGSAGITDGGHNLDDDGSCGFSAANGSLSTNPQLDPAGLKSNGGPTQTIALQAGSPAINAGNESVCAAPPVNNLDQRGGSRPGAGATNCSIGAYEFNSPGASDCCQCPTSCAVPVNGSCGGCMVVFGASCEAEEICVLSIPTQSRTPTRTQTPTASPTRTQAQTPTASAAPTPTATKTPGPNDCCQCTGLCAAPIVGTCGGCAVVLGAFCSGGLCISRTPMQTATASMTPTATATSTLTLASTATRTATPSATSTNTATLTTMPTVTRTPTPIATATHTPTATPTVTSTPQACVGDCEHVGAVTVNELITMVNIALGNTPLSACRAGDADGNGTIEINEIIAAVNNALQGCPRAESSSGAERD